MYAQEIEDRDYELSRHTSLADDHRAWHTVHGWLNGCPLDCIDADYVAEPATLADEIAMDVAERGIRCGACGDRHPDVRTVRDCHVARRMRDRRRG